MRTTRTAAAVLLVAALTGCNSGPDKAACETAMRAAAERAMSDPNAPAATRPAACKGVSDADLQAMAERIMATSVPTP